MSSHSDKKPEEPSRNSGKATMNYLDDESPEALARYMEIVADYPNEVSRRWAMLRGEAPPRSSDQEGKP